MLRRGRHDLVVLDLAMPGMGGLEACRAIRAGWDLAIVILSVRDMEKDKIGALDAGADDYVTKPFSMQELLARIRAGLRRSPLAPEARPSMVRNRRAGDQFRRAPGHRGGPRSPADPQGVRPAALSGRQAQYAHSASPPAAGGVGAGLWQRGGVSARVHQPAPQEDRAGASQAALHPDRALHRISIPYAAGCAHERVDAGDYRTPRLPRRAGRRTICHSYRSTSAGAIRVALRAG